MWIEVLAVHSTMAFVGVGLVTYLFACLVLAEKLDKTASGVTGPRYVVLRTARYVLGPLCAPFAGLPLLFLLLHARVPLESSLTLLVAMAFTATLYVKYKVFGKVHFLW